MHSSGDGVGDYLHVNYIGYLGPNRWYEHRDVCFKSDDVIFDCHETNIFATLDKESGKIVWRIDPDFSAAPELRELGWITGRHHFHIMPEGLLGEGNLMVFGNGGQGGYGVPDPGNRNGSKSVLRDYSRVLEFNPIIPGTVWKLTPKELAHAIPADASKSYSPYVSSVQRLPNGNTLVMGGSDGRIIEVTADHEVVWEWISSYYMHNETGLKNNMIYRGYRYPYSYVSQEPTPTEITTPCIDNTTFRMPNIGTLGTKAVTDVEGTLPYYQDMALCVATGGEEDLGQREKIFSVDTAVFEPINGMMEWKDKAMKQREKPVLILFGAEYCVHCKALHPVLEEVLQKEFANSFLIRYVDVDANKDITTACHVQGVLVVAVYHGSEEVRRLHGEHDYGDIYNFLDVVFA